MTRPRRPFGDPLRSLRQFFTPSRSGADLDVSVPMPAKLPLDARSEDTPHGHFRGLLGIVPLSARGRTVYGRGGRVSAKKAPGIPSRANTKVFQRMWSHGEPPTAAASALNPGSDGARNELTSP
jgi:hypothetical protein